ncbi:hypothetical protein RB195_017960 [Necator americanus]|uniref:Uncharacterized protein n=1 Tax=Necator americanus TaxID=51031 RepID=A0ABR1C8K1_NECAM
MDIVSASSSRRSNRVDSSVFKDGSPHRRWDKPRDDCLRVLEETFEEDIRGINMNRQPEELDKKLGLPGTQKFASAPLESTLDDAR